MKKAGLIFCFIPMVALANLWMNGIYDAPIWVSPAEHFIIGGMFVAWLVIASWQWLEPASLREANGLKCFGEIIAWTALIGVLWEIFEFFVFQKGLSNQQWLYDDTLWDFVMDLAGGSVAVLAYIWKRKGADQ